MRLERLRRALRAVRNYIRYDLQEIVAPSSLPDPPGVKHRSLTLVQYWQAAKRATQEYRKTWRPEQKPEPGQAGTGESGQQPSADAPISEDLAAAARGGAEALKPLLAQLYQTRAAAYRDSLRAFVEGYREGLAAPPGSWEGIAGPGPGGADKVNTAGQRASDTPQGANTSGERTSGSSAGSGVQHSGAALGAVGAAIAGTAANAQGAVGDALRGAASAGASMAAAPAGNAANVQGVGSNALHRGVAGATSAASTAKAATEQGAAAGGSTALSRAATEAGTPGAAAGGRSAAGSAGSAGGAAKASAAAGGGHEGGKPPGSSTDPNGRS